MSRYGDNCEAHDMPHGECIHCVREELSSSIAEIEKLKAELEDARYDRKMALIDEQHLVDAEMEIKDLQLQLAEANYINTRLQNEYSDKWDAQQKLNDSLIGINNKLRKQLAEAKEHMRLAGVGPYKANYTIEGLTLNGQLAEVRAENETLKSVAAEKVVERAKLADLLAEASAEVERLIIQRDFAQSELQDVITTRFEARREVTRECIEAFEAEYGILGLAFTLRQRFGLDEE